MSVAVDIRKTIRNGHLDTVTCTYTQTVFDAVRKTNLDHGSSIYENCLFLHGKNKENEWALWLI